MRRASLLLAVIVLVGILPAVDAGAQLSAVGREANPVTVEMVPPPGDPVTLVLDDGSRDNDIGIGGTLEFVFLNRFSPSEFPIELTDVTVYFSSVGLVNIGDSYDVYLYENTSGNTDPAVGASYVGGQTGNAIAVLDNWNEVTLGSPLTFAGPGDVLVAVVHRETPGTSVWPASIDQTATLSRSWIGWDDAGNVPDPPTLPPPNWTNIDAYFPGNWMVRAYGMVVPVELMSLSVD